MTHRDESLALSRRLRAVRAEIYGEGGVPALAEALRLPARTWDNFEAGVTIPGVVLLRFIALTGCDPRWLLIGEGRRYSGRSETPDRSDAN